MLIFQYLKVVVGVERSQRGIEKIDFCTLLGFLFSLTMVAAL